MNPSLSASASRPRLRDAALTCLYVVILLQCLGVAGRYYFSANEAESDIYGLLYFDSDWPEETAQRIDDAGAVASLIAGIMLLVSVKLISTNRLGRFAIRLLQTVCLLVVAGWALALPAAHMVRGELFAEFALAEDAVCYVGPLAMLLLLICRDPVDRPSSIRETIAIGLLTVAAAATFLAHGYKAVQLYGPFTDLILLSNANWLQLNLQQSSAESALAIIGWIDIGLAVLLLATRSRSVAAYMACWGLITAVSRVAALGTAAWPETFIRAANAGVPLALMLLYSGGKVHTDQQTSDFTHKDSGTTNVD